MKTLTAAASIAWAVMACNCCAQAQQRTSDPQPSYPPQQAQQREYVPPQTLGPLKPSTLPRQSEQEIVYLGHEQARLGITLAEDEKGHVWVRTIIAGSPADRAHLRPGDQIVAMNESNIRSYADAVRFINASHPDQEVTIAINRDGQAGGVTAVLGWARGMRANVRTVPSNSVQLQIAEPGRTYNPEYVYPNNPNEYQKPLNYGHMGTDRSTATPNSAQRPMEGIGGLGNRP